MPRQAHLDHFGALYDPIHGTLDVADVVSPSSQVAGSIAGILRSPLIDRLRRIKQLGFASYQFVGADHSRYAHALGTLHMMRALLRRVPEDLQVRVIERLSYHLPTAKRMFVRARKARLELTSVLAQYTLAAALLQDIGELPYETATGLIFRPDAETLRRVRTHVGHDVFAWQPKQIFGIASLVEADVEVYLRGFDLQLLAFLIVGKRYPWVNQEPALLAWLNILEGEVDADRLDYVYRDAHHTVGVKGDPQAVVDTLLRYDDVGPVVADVGPIIDFLATRANLWRTVYLSPQNRFRRLLLIELLRDIYFNEKCKPCADLFSSGQVTQELGMGGFRTFDDLWLWGRLREVSEEARLRKSLSARARLALELLLGQRSEYEHVWVRARDGRDKAHHGIELPDELFFDTYRELYRHHFYEPASVRIDAPSLKYLDAPLALEEAYFGGFMAPDWVPQPVLKAAQVFLPSNRQGAQWESVQKLLTSGQLYDVLLRNDSIVDLEVPTDTRDNPDCRGPAIFVSFKWDDIDVVDEVLREMYANHRRYYALRGLYDGIGDTTAENSRNAVRAADAVILIASVQYGTAYQRDPNGNIHLEVVELMKRRDPTMGKQVPLAPLSVDPWTAVQNSLPWLSLGYTREPFFGEALKGKSREKVAAAVEAALKYIDLEYERQDRF